jgi:3-hydroxymyristoyl/3-hydroxydecanoyl-(acyl carrier protein) dehydratase
MNALREAIKKRMEKFECAEESVAASFSFDKDFIGFKGHFENRPILPGICKVQAVLLMLEEKYKKTITLLEAENVKFFHPVTCGEKLEFVCKDPLLGREKSVKCMVSKDGAKIADIQLKILIGQ